MSGRIAAWILGGSCVILVAASGASVGCQRPAAQPTREVGPGVLVIRMPSALGKMRRPPVAFDHDKHTAAVGDGCKTCHLVDRAGTLIPKFGRVNDGQSASRLQDFYHDRCLGCHKRRGKGARTCGECHAKGPGTRSTWKELRMDYSLHARHVLVQQNRCADCHHVYDKRQQKLVYKKGAEESCRACHSDRAVGRRPSLRVASHQACVSCHLRTKGAGLASGPLDCAQCHGVWAQAKIKRLERPARLMRGQKDRLWVGAEASGRSARRVPFNHKAHEKTGSSCSTCHHRTLDSCAGCHTPTGVKKGGGVNLAQAHHDPGSLHSCVGCHSKATQEASCAGCHHTIKAEASRRSCGVCHSGPKAGTPAVTKAGTKAGPLPASPAAEARVQSALPPYSKDFPERVTIKRLARDYAPVVMEHGSMVRKLHSLAGKSALAVRFHGGVKALCAGCHHQAKPGTRPAPCSACHTRRSSATRDRPGLRAAYHRQCVGCHQKMGLTKWLGCETCHKKRPSNKAAGSRPRGGVR
jgi:Class III cytochrome C family